MVASLTLLHPLMRLMTIYQDPSVRPFVCSVQRARCSLRSSGVLGAVACLSWRPAGCPNKCGYKCKVDCSGNGKET